MCRHISKIDKSYPTLLMFCIAFVLLLVMIMLIVTAQKANFRGQKANFRSQKAYILDHVVTQSVDPEPYELDQTCDGQ
jgi:hypothetical protein